MAKDNYHNHIDTEAENQRLSSQHELIKFFCNGLVKAPIDLTKSGQRVLDSATADGFWMREMRALMHPTTEFLGFDIIPGLEDSQEKFPKNIKLKEQSVLEDFPVEWTNAFDLVHQRLLLVLFPDEDVVKILRRLVDCVKPGGWIQLFEGDGSKQLYDRRARYFEVFYRITEKTLKSPEIGRYLSDYLHDAGMINVKHEAVDFEIGAANPDRKIASRAVQNILGVVDLVKPFTSADAVGLSQEEWINLGKNMENDLKKYKVAMRYHTVWAQKPWEVGS
ncbi:S-adenosyl-L-methionine-dependent methyltransferase [Aspergillus floccosus]